jgi:hypothetical protein
MVRRGEAESVRPAASAAGLTRCSGEKGDQLRAQLPEPLFFQFRWTSQFLPPMVMLYFAPFDAVEVVPNVHAHLSAFS